MGNKVIRDTSIKQGIYEESEDAKGDIGGLKGFEDGRIYIYAKNGGTALEPGLIVEGPAENAYDESITLVKDIAIGDTTITIVVNALRSYTANELAGGWVQIEDVAGGIIGHARKIESHPAAAASTSMVITVYNAFTDTATAGTDTVNVMENMYNGVIICPTTHTGPIAGVPPIHVTADYYFWLQVAGICSFIAGAATIVVGDGLVVTGLAGTVKQAAGADDEFVGWAYQSQDTSANALIGMLCIGRR